MEESDFKYCLQIAHKPLVLQDFSKSYNFTPTILLRIRLKSRVLFLFLLRGDWVRTGRCRLGEREKPARAPQCPQGLAVRGPSVPTPESSHLDHKNSMCQGLNPHMEFLWFSNFSICFQLSQMNSIEYQICTSNK